MRKINCLFFALIELCFASCSGNSDKVAGAYSTLSDSLTENTYDTTQAKYMLVDEIVTEDIGNLHKDTIPKEIILTELRHSMQIDPIEEADGKICTNLRLLPDNIEQAIIHENRPMQLINIESRNWAGEIREALDSDKLSYQINADTVYYELARKLVINLRNRSTGVSIKKEIRRNDVRLAKGETFGMFNLYGWDISKLSEDSVIINQVITKLDSDVGDDLHITLTKEGKIDIHNISVKMD